MNKKMLSILCALSLIAFAGPAFADHGGPDALMSDSFNETTSIDATMDYTGAYGSYNTKSETETLSVTKTETDVEDSFNDKTVTIDNTDNSTYDKTTSFTSDSSDNSVSDKTVTIDDSDNSVSDKTVTVTETYRKSESEIEDSYNTANVQDESINIEAILEQTAVLILNDDAAVQSAFGDELKVENSIELDDALNGWTGVSNNAQSAGSFNNNGIMNVIAVGRDLIP